MRARSTWWERGEEGEEESALLEMQLVLLQTLWIFHLSRCPRKRLYCTFSLCLCLWTVEQHQRRQQSSQAFLQTWASSPYSCVVVTFSSPSCSIISCTCISSLGHNKGKIVRNQGKLKSLEGLENWIHRRAGNDSRVRGNLVSFGNCHHAQPHITSAHDYVHPWGILLVQCHWNA